MTQPLIVTMGELMLRLSAPGRELLLQSPRFDTCFGGAEANVAVALARLGTPARFVTTLPAGTFGDRALAGLRGEGVDTAHIARAEGRLGLYFLEMGAGSRASDVIYDRAGSTFALMGTADTDWQAALAPATWLHVSGISLAVSEAAQRSVSAAVAAARALGVKISFDCNFRPRLWDAREVDPVPIITSTVSQADLIFADHRDVRLLTGEQLAGDDPVMVQRDTAARLFERFPQLSCVAGVARRVVSHDSQTLIGGLHGRNGDAATSRPRVLSGIVDRVGGGDAFAAGLLHAMATGLATDQAIEFAVATGVLKHSIPGDFFRLGASAVEQAIAGGGDIRR